MTTAQNGHGPTAAITCSASDSRDPSTGASQNGACGADAEAQGAKLSPSKLVRLFSMSRKRMNAHAERPRSMVLVGNSSTWNALASFRKMGSFKKLKSSVLQGIQNREGSDPWKEEAAERDSAKALANGAVPGGPAGRCSLSTLATEPLKTGDGCGSDCSDPEDADDAFQRSTHRSRSIRRAYGLGRISLLDAEKPQDSQHPGRPLSPILQEPALCEILLKDSESDSIAYRRSKSTDNLSFLRKSSFKRKSASNLADLRAAAAHDKPQVPQRTLSSSSTDSDKLGGSERRTKRWRSPIRAMDLDRVLKFVSNVTDAAWKREGPKGAAPAPAEAHPTLGLHSRLHDDYSRRVSSCTEPDRRCAASPVRSVPASFPAATCHDARIDVDTAVFPLEAQSSGPPESNGPRTSSSSSSGPLASELSSQDAGEPRSGSRFTFESEQPPTPLRPTTPKPPSPQSPGALSYPSNLSVLSLSSVESEGKAEDPAQREAGPATCQDSMPTTAGIDENSQDSGSGSHPPLSPVEKKEEQVRAWALPAKDVAVAGEAPEPLGDCWVCQAPGITVVRGKGSYRRFQSSCAFEVSSSPCNFLETAL